MVVSLPNRLQQLETQITQILRNQDQFGLRFQELEKQVTDLDRRTIRLELNR
jgi:exonuclease VII small subunit